MPKNKSDSDDTARRKHPLQAAILANDWERQQPSVTWPLTPSTSILEATVSFLRDTCNISDIWIVCQQEMPAYDGCRILCDANIGNAGDALRELDKRSVIQSDPFVLVQGGIAVASAQAVVELQQALAAHSARAAKDASVCLTILASENSNSSNSTWMGVSTHNQRLVYYSNADTLALPTSFCTAQRIRLHALKPTGLLVGSPTVLARFSDNFDYRHLWDEFVTQSVQEEEEGLQNRLFVHITKSVIETLDSWKSYGRTAVHQVPQGWKGGGKVVGHSASLVTGTVDASATVTDSVVLGTVQAGARLENAIVCPGAVVSEGAVVPRGCVIGPGCVVGKNVVLPEFTRLVLVQDGNDDDDDDWGDDEEDATKEVDKELEVDTQVVGVDGKGVVWTGDLDEDDDEEDKKQFYDRLRQTSFGFDLKLDVQDETDDETDDFSDAPADDGLGAGGGYDDGLGGEVTFDYDTEIPVYTPEDENVVEILKTFCSEFGDTAPIENLAIELNSLKFSHNATYSDCIQASTAVMLENMKITTAMSDINLVQVFKTALKRWGPLFNKLSISTEEERVIIETMESTAYEDTEMGKKLSSDKAFRFLLQTMHDEDIVSEEAILEWADEREQDKEAKLYWIPAVQDFITWLKEVEEESDDDEDEDESDEEE